MPDEILIVPVGILVAAVITTAFLIRHQGSIKRELSDVVGFLSEVRSITPRSALARTTKAHVVSSSQDEPFVLDKSLEDIRRDYAEAAVSRHVSFWLGSLFTGVALIFTFVLIAIVMTGDVSDAIKESADQSKLSDAVGLLGAKFYISAAGVGASLILLFAGNFARGRILALAENPDLQLLESFTSLEAYELATKRAELDLVQADRATRAEHHAELCGHFARLDRGIEKLSSIEVSVQTIGNEVSANLKNIMKEAMGEQLKELLRDTMIEVAGIATSVQQNLTESFGQQLATLATSLQQGIDGLKTAVEGQGQGQLEQILGKLQDTVSGGFQSESTKMVAALEGFASVVPALEKQLREMTGKVAQESRERSEESSRATETLLSRVTLLMDSLGAQQAANAQAIDRMRAASEQGADDIARRLEASGSHMVSSVLGASRTEIEAIVGQLKAAAQESAGRYVDMETHAGNAAHAVMEATAGLTSASRSILEMSNHTSAVLTQARAGSEAIQVASQQFLQAGNTLLGSVSSMREIIENSRTQTGEQHQLLMRQREYTQEVEKLWPQLFDTYLAKFKASSEELGSTWDSFHTKISGVTTSVGAQLTESTENLNDSVKELVKVYSKSARELR